MIQHSSHTQVYLASSGQVVNPQFRVRVLLTCALCSHCIVSSITLSLSTVAREAGVQLRSGTTARTYDQEPLKKKRVGRHHAEQLKKPPKTLKKQRLVNALRGLKLESYR